MTSRKLRPHLRVSVQPPGRLLLLRGHAPPPHHQLLPPPLQHTVFQLFTAAARASSSSSSDTHGSWGPQHLGGRPPWAQPIYCGDRWQDYELLAMFSASGGAISIGLHPVKTVAVHRTSLSVKQTPVAYCKGVQLQAKGLACSVGSASAAASAIAYCFALQARSATSLQGGIALRQHLLQTALTQHHLLSTRSATKAQRTTMGGVM